MGGGCYKPQGIAGRQLAFQRKQRALHNALLIGAQIARRNRRDLCTAVLRAWLLRSRAVKKLKIHLAARMAASKQSCWSAWKHYLDYKVRIPAAPTHSMYLKCNTAVAAQLHGTTARYMCQLPLDSGFLCAQDAILVLHCPSAAHPMVFTLLP